MSAQRAISYAIIFLCDSFLPSFASQRAPRYVTRIPESSHRRVLATTTRHSACLLPHAQSDRDVSHLAMLTAKIKGRILDTGVGFAPTESSTTHKGNRCSPAWENGAHVGASVWPRTPLIRCRGGETAP